ncbi:MAG: YsnF/AvaK domain-containing protein [Chloroflexi bacterium]|nr:YsnF/AvaK domain-containing protein [Chloroflexota bacterium]MBV9598505.1 YsnF/AvaK domain-containing protein [Chloroflexota bacterium]
MQNQYFSQVHEGMEVLDMDGQKIGMCGERLGDYFNVDAGFLGTNEYYVPFSAVTNVVDDQIFLNVRKDRIDEMGWHERPERRSGATYTRAETDTAARTATRGADRMELREEELQARKTSVETGSVQLGKDVVEEERTLEVPVTREEVFVERRPVDRRESSTPISDAETETIRVPVTEERVEVDKQPVVYEEVGVNKRVTQETQPVSETVRREELRVDESGDVKNVRKDPKPKQ